MAMCLSCLHQRSNLSCCRQMFSDELSWVCRDDSCLAVHLTHSPMVLLKEVVLGMKKDFAITFICPMFSLALIYIFLPFRCDSRPVRNLTREVARGLI